MRKITRSVTVGDVVLGNQMPIVIQSMTNTSTKDIDATVDQIKRLEEAGCQIVRVAVPDMESARALAKIKEKISIPLVADIHYDYRLALAAIENGADKIRINPGNIGDKEKVRQILIAAKKAKIPIRIGVNSGSLPKEILNKYGSPTPEALFESMREYIEFCESEEFYDLVLSVKASNVPDTIATNRLLSQNYDYPLHLGITEAGFGESAIIKSSIGIGSLLNDGIGDTIRVSLTDDPVAEIHAAREILSALGLKGPKEKPVLISCPTCARTKIDLMDISRQVKERLDRIDKNLTVAVMGCSVNGPGEARHADIGIAGTGRGAVLFKKGEIVKYLKEDEVVETLFKEIEAL